MQDAELIELFLAGDRLAVRRTRSWIQGTLAGYRAGLGHELEDLEQEILVQLIQALREGRFRRQSRLKTYVKSFTHHKAIDRLRAAGRRHWVDIDSIDPPAGEESAFDRLARSQQTEIALQVVAESPEQCRELWRMLEQGLSYKEMSRRLGIAAGTLRARVMRCRQRALQTRRSILEKLYNKTRNRTTK